MEQKCLLFDEYRNIKKEFHSNINIVIGSEVPTIKGMFRSQSPIN